MKRQTTFKSVRYGINSRPSTKSTVLFALATFFVVIQLVKSSTVREEDDFSDNNSRAGIDADGERMKFFPLDLIPVPISIGSGKRKLFVGPFPVSR